jgi:tRNA pseudouridine13 synthase
MYSPHSLISNVRYQDFHVKEIDTDGNVMHLDELITRAEIAEEMRNAKTALEARYASLGTDFMMEEIFVAKIEKLMSSEDVDSLKSFLKTPVNESTPYCNLKSEKLNGDKDNRRSFHALIRENYGDILTTDTLEEGNVRSILVWIKKYQEQEQLKFKQESKSTQNDRKRQRADRRDTSGISVGVMMKNPWPSDRPDHLHFRLYKENRDTAEAIQSISRCLGIPPKSFSFCGTKDRRGITVQSVSVYRVSIDDTKKAIMHSSWDMAVRVSHMEYKSYPNKIGRSNGNRFKICLRRIPHNFEKPQIDELFQQLQHRGFINYYGLQRFGTRSVRTHQIGSLLLAQNWKGAVDALLSPEADNLLADSSTSIPTNNRSEWRIEYQKGDIPKALELCPPYMYIERSLLRALDKSGQSGNYLNAIQSLPSSNFQLYLHAVQSLAFNAALSERIRSYGLDVQVGDLVQTGSSELGNVKVIESLEEASQFTINDVVMTLVGTTVQIPPIMESFYTDFFENALKIPIADLTGKGQKVPSLIQLKGAYRRIIQQAKNLKWEICQDVSDRNILIRSDVDILKNADIPPRSTEQADRYTAVVFECDLDSGAYLTMAVREISEVSELQPIATPEETD